jgi:hypothetical protein
MEMSVKLQDAKKMVEGLKITIEPVGWALMVGVCCIASCALILLSLE